MDLVTEGWNEQLVNDLFCLEDTKDILAIPVRGETDDHVAWHFDPKGWFSVKSAYQLGARLRDARLCWDASSSTLQVQVNNEWSRIWKLEMPGKVRIFLWRLAHNSLPLRMNIKRKKVELDTRCPMCHRPDEDGGHLFLKCKMVKHVWRAMDMEDTRLALVNCASQPGVLDHLWNLDSAKRDTAVVLLLEWWSAHNKVDARDKVRMCEDVCFTVRRHLQDFKGNTVTHREPDGLAGDGGWRRPPENFVKVNFDAAFYEQSWMGACTDQGVFLAARAGSWSI